MKSVERRSRVGVEMRRALLGKSLVAGSLTKIFLYHTSTYNKMRITKLVSYSLLFLSYASMLTRYRAVVFPYKQYFTGEKDASLPVF